MVKSDHVHLVHWLSCLMHLIMTPLGPAVDPTLVNVAGLSNPMFMQARNAMPAAPNVSTSDPEHESSPESPLSNPPVEVSSQMVL
jgi:hypothetical protein